MKTRFLILFIAVLLALPLAYVAKKSADKPQFHLPQTEAEKVLDHILIMDRDDLYLMDFICKEPKRTKNWDKEYDPFFTKELQDAWSKDCLSIPVETDGTRYVGESYITGGSGDGPDHFVFYTVRGNDHEAYIDIAAPEDAKGAKPSEPPPFKMVKEGGLWKLDSVDLGPTRYNVK
jgi:hypothetical protein